MKTLLIAIEDMLCALGGNNLAKEYLKDKNIVLYSGWTYADYLDYFKYFKLINPQSDILEYKKFLETKPIFFAYGKEYLYEDNLITDYTGDIHETKITYLVDEDITRTYTFKNDFVTEFKERLSKYTDLAIYLNNDDFKGLIGSYITYTSNPSFFKHADGLVYRKYGYGALLTALHYFEADTETVKDYLTKMPTRFQGLQNKLTFKGIQVI